MLTATPTTSLGTSSQESQQDDKMEDYLICSSPTPAHPWPDARPLQSFHISPLMGSQLSQSDNTNEKHCVRSQEDLQEKQVWKDTLNTLYASLLSFLGITVESRVQVSTDNPNVPLAFGVIRWIGDVKNHGITAGMEMVNCMFVTAAMT
jgi:hypothetical protein